MPEQLSLPAGAARSSPDPYGDDWDAGFLDAVVTLLDDRPSASPAAPPVPSASMPRGPAGAGGPAASAEIMPAAMSPVIVAGPRPLVRHVELELDVDEADAQRNRPSAEGSRDDSGADDMVVDVVASGESTSTTPEPPKSLFQLFRSRRGYFSVTDLCAPVWCEVQYDYGLRGKRFLPVAERPKTFLSARGKAITPNVEQATVNAKIMDAGSVIHQRLEKEIHPVEVKVDVTTREERWALRLLNMLTAVEALIELGICREMPVMGFIKGHFVVGIVDEIQRRPLAPASTLVSSLSPAETAASQAAGANSQATSSQWEAKRLQARSSPRKKVAATAPVVPKTTPITSFFRPKDNEPIVLDDDGEDNVAAVLDASSESSRDALVEPAAGLPHDLTIDSATVPASRSSSGVTDTVQVVTPSSQPTHALFVSDSKTRRSYSLPRDDAALSGRLQCQLYKLLLDESLAPLRSPSSLSSHLPAELATSVLSRVFSQFDLDPTARLSDGFCAQAQTLIDGNSIKIDWRGDHNLTLESLARCWDVSVDRLGIDRCKGIDDELQLVYRYQSPVSKPTGSGKGTGKRKSRRAKESAVPSQPTQTEENQQLQLAIQAPLAYDSSGGVALPAEAAADSTQPTADESDDDQLQLAIRMSLAAVDSGPPVTPLPTEEPHLVPVSPSANAAKPASVARSPQPGACRAVLAESSIERIDDGPVEVPEGAFDPLPAPLVLDKPTPTASSTPLGATWSVAIVEGMLSGTSKPAALLSKAEKVAELMRLRLVELKVLARKEGQPDWGAKNVLANRIFKARAERDKNGEDRSDPAQAPSPEKPAKRSKVGAAVDKLAPAAAPSTDSFFAPPPGPLRSKADDDIIGVKTFRFEAAELDAHLEHVLAFWLGEREPIGVPLDETFKCNSCELRESCEWRAEEADRIWAARTQARAGASAV